MADKLQSRKKNFFNFSDGETLRKQYNIGRTKIYELLKNEIPVLGRRLRHAEAIADMIYKIKRHQILQKLM